MRDNFGEGESGSPNGAVSYICNTCFTGFSLRESPRVHFVNRMYALERQKRPNENEHRTFVGAKPLTQRSVFELQRIEQILRAKTPRSRASAEHIRSSLAAVHTEMDRRGIRPSTLTYRIGEVYPPGSIPVKS